MGSTQGAVHMAAALAGCRKALVGTGLAISLPFDTNGVDKAPLGSISATVDSFHSGEAFTGWMALTIVSSLMSGLAEVMNPERLDRRTLSRSFKC